MSNEWAKVEITATTKRTKSAAQVEAEYRANEWAQLNDRIDANRAKLAKAGAKLNSSAGMTALKKAISWDATVATGAKIDNGNKSVLDKSAKSNSPITNSAEENLRNLAGGGFANSFTGMSLGSSLADGVSKKLSKLLPTKLATNTEVVKAGAIKQVPGLVTGGLSDISSNSKNLLGGGLGQSGGFNPAGVAFDTTSDPSSGNYIKLATSVFTSGTTVLGETVDIYDNIDHSPQNKVKSILSDVLGAANSSVLGSLKTVLLKAAGGANNLTGTSLSLNAAKETLGKFKNTLLSGVPLTKDGMLTDLYESIGYDGKTLAFKGGLKGIGESMLGEITKNMDGQTGLISLYKGTKKILDGDGDTASNLFKIVENFTGNTQFAGLLDLGAEFKIIANVSKALIEMGAIEQLEKVFEKIDHKDRDRYIADNLETGINSGDVEFLKFALKNMSGAKILAAYPDVIVRIASAFRPKVDDDDNINVTDYYELVECLNSITPNWDSAGTHHGLKVYDYGVFSMFNNQAKLAILASNKREHIAALISAENFQGIFDIGPQLQVRYPDYPII